MYWSYYLRPFFSHFGHFTMPVSRLVPLPWTCGFLRLSWRLNCTLSRKALSIIGACLPSAMIGSSLSPFRFYRSSVYTSQTVSFQCKRVWDDVSNGRNAKRFRFLSHITFMIQCVRNLTITMTFSVWLKNIFNNIRFMLIDHELFFTVRYFIIA